MYDDNFYESNYPNTNYGTNFNESLITTSIFIVMVLIFLAVLLAACCKILISYTTRTFMNRNRSDIQNIYNIPSEQRPRRTRPEGEINFAENPPAYDELSVYSLPPAYNIPLSKVASKEDIVDNSVKIDVQTTKFEGVIESLKRGESRSVERRHSAPDVCGDFFVGILPDFVVKEDDSDEGCSAVVIENMNTNN